MTINIARGAADDVIDTIIGALGQYQSDHPQAEIDLYRQNPVSVRIRIVDPDFHGTSKSQRSEVTWRYLEHLSEEVQADISMLLLLTPDEVGKSFANFEFNDPVPSKL